MDTKQPKDVLQIDRNSQVVIRDASQMQRYFAQLLASKALPSHITTIEQLWAAHALLTAVGLDWRGSLKDTWRNPKTGTFSICNDAPLAACQKQRAEYVATVEYHVNEKGERRTKDNFIGFKIAGAVCIAKRRGREDQEGLFTLDEAKAAGLMSKNNWASFPAAMLRMRARAIALRAQWPDVLGGVPIREGDEGFGETATPRPVTQGHALVVDMLGDEVTETSAPPTATPADSPSSFEESDEDVLFGDLDREPGGDEG